MHLYLMKRTADIGWDEARGFVIRAKSFERARKIAAANCGGEGRKIWSSVCITKLGDALGDTEEVVLRDYLHG